MIVEMKDKPKITEEIREDSDGPKVVLVITVEKEQSAKDIDLDISETELKLKSENYELHYKLKTGIKVDPDSVIAKFSKVKKTLSLTINII